MRLGVDGGALRRQYGVRPRQLSLLDLDLEDVYQNLSGTEFFLRPGVGLEAPLSESISVAVRMGYNFSVLRSNWETYSLEQFPSTVFDGSVEMTPEGVRQYKIHNPQFSGPVLQLAFQFDIFRVSVGRQWLAGSASGVRLFRDEWLMAAGVML